MPRLRFPSESHSDTTRMLSNPFRKPYRDNSPYPSTLFRELSRQPLYALCKHFYSEVRPDKPVYFRINSCLGVKLDKPVRSYSRYLLRGKPTMSVYSHSNSPSAWKLSQANWYVSARISFEG